MANELYIKRTAVGDLALTGGTAAFTSNSGVYIPAGAVITGVRWVAANTAITTTNASQTVVAKVGTQAIGVTLNVKTLPAQTVGLPNTLAATGGVIVTAAGELNIVGGATGTSTGAGTWKYFVDYLYVNDTL